MTELFADTFYWIALADFTDSAHRQALELTSTLKDVPIVTTDEVLTEYLTFFATAPESMRRKALATAQRILEIPVFELFRRAGTHFYSVWHFTALAPTSATA